MIVKQFTFITLLLSLLCACTLQANESDVAILPDNSHEARTEIIAVVSSALNGKKIPIADDVFKESSRLLLTAQPVTSPNGVNVYSKKIQPALVFELRKRGDTCLLRRIDTEQEWLLKTKACFKQ